MSSPEFTNSSTMFKVNLFKLWLNVENVEPGWGDVQSTTEFIGSWKVPDSDGALGFCSVFTRAMQ